MSFNTRLFYLLSSWLPVGIIYLAASFITGDVWIVPETYMDRLIPFSPSGIWFYLLFYVYIPYTFLIVNEAKIKSLRYSFILTACISGIIFVLFPSSIQYPEFETDGVSAFILNFVMETDAKQNCFPSLHGSLITICTIVNLDKAKKLRSYCCILFALLMYYSIIQPRRHVFIDLAAGIFIGLFSYFLVSRIRQQIQAEKC